MNTVTVELPPEAVEGLKALGIMLQQLSPLELAYRCGEVHGRLERQRAKAREEKKEAQ